MNFCIWCILTCCIFLLSRLTDTIFCLFIFRISNFCNNSYTLFRCIRSFCNILWILSPVYFLLFNLDLFASYLYSPICEFFHCLKPKKSPPESWLTLIPIFSIFSKIRLFKFLTFQQTKFGLEYLKLFWKRLTSPAPARRFKHQVVSGTVAAVELLNLDILNIDTQTATD